MPHGTTDAGLAGIHTLDTGNAATVAAARARFPPLPACADFGALLLPPPPPPPVARPPPHPNPTGARKEAQSRA